MFHSTQMWQVFAWFFSGISVGSWNSFFPPTKYTQPPCVDSMDGDIFSDISWREEKPLWSLTKFSCVFEFKLVKCGGFLGCLCVRLKIVMFIGSSHWTRSWSWQSCDPPWCKWHLLGVYLETITSFSSSSTWAARIRVTGPSSDAA